MTKKVICARTDFGTKKINPTPKAISKAFDNKEKLIKIERSFKIRCICY